MNRALVRNVFKTQDFSVSPSPLGTDWAFELGLTVWGLGLGGSGTKGLGLGLDNFMTLSQPPYQVPKSSKTECLLSSFNSQTKTKWVKIS